MNRTSFVIFTVLLAVLLMFSGTEVKAEFEELVQPVTTCTLTAANGNVGGTVTLTKTDAYTWQYDFSGISSRTNQISLICPVCDPEIDFVATNVSSYNLLIPGEAESASGMNYANFQYRVLRTSPVLLGSGGTVIVKTYNAAGAPVETDTRASSLLLKSGNTDYFCKNLAAPACGGLATSSVTTSQTIVANNGATFEGVVFDKFSQCVKSVASCSGQTCRTIPFEEFEAGHGKLKDISIPGQVCTNIIIEDDQTNSTYYCSRSGVCYY